MFRHPGLSIIAMVCFSMTLAVVYHQWTTSGSVELTSKVLPGGESFNSVEDMITGASARSFSFETEESCDSRRLYFLRSKEFAEIPSIFRETRSVQPAEFSRNCATYVMRHYGDVESVIDGKKPSTANFALCSSLSTSAEANFWPPCVTEEYVNVVYNTFGDVMSCLRLPQKEYLPKFFLESGLHINVLGNNSGDVGLGQLNETSVPQLESIKVLAEEINKSDDPACVHLQKPMAKIDFSVFEKNPSKTTCALISTPNNPLLSMILVAAKYREDMHAVENYLHQKVEWRNDDFVDFEAMVRRSGLVDLSQPNHEEMLQEVYEKLKEIVVIQAYHLGPGKAATLMRNYFLDNLHQGVLLQRSDFNFHVGYEHFRAKVNAKSLPAHLTYPEYIYVHYPPGSAGGKSYLVRMAEFADELNRKLKEGTCVSESYLAL